MSPFLLSDHDFQETSLDEVFIVFVQEFTVVGLTDKICSGRKLWARRSFSELVALLRTNCQSWKKFIELLPLSVCMCSKKCCAPRFEDYGF